MIICIDNRSKQKTGIGTYTFNLIRRLRKENIRCIKYEDGVHINRNSGKKYIYFGLRLIKELFFINKILKKEKVSLYHVPRNTGVPLISSTPIVVTIHDIIPHIFPEIYLNNYLERLYYEFAIRVSIHKASKIITISKFSKDELIRCYGVNPEKIKITYLAYNNSFKKMKNEGLFKSIRRKYNIQGKYILTIGGSEYRKNIERLINVYNSYFQNDYKMIIIGGKWRNVDLPSRYESPNIKFLTNVPESDLVAIYNLAEVFVFPSIYEGFGIPVLEGMACGVPVVTSNVSSMPEVGGEAAIYFDPFDEHDMAEKIRRVLEDRDLRKEMVKKGLERVKMFSWEKCAEETLKVYNEILKN